MEGSAEQVTDKNTITAVLAGYVDVATDDMKHVAPITKLDWEKGVVIYKISPTWLRWSDFADTPPKEKSEMVTVLINKIT